MSSNPEKRKEKEEKEGDNEDAHGSTLFVSNLPYTATSVDLETLFSDIAPVRTAFVVTEQGTGVSKGVGYVSFALKEDAEACFKQVTDEGLKINKRKIRIQWADKKLRKPLENGASTEKKEPKPKTAGPARPREPITKTPHDPLAVRTVIVAGLPSPLDSNTLWKKIRKCAGAETLTYPAKDISGEDDPTQAHVLFTHPSKASAAVDKLHAHVYKGSLLSATLKKRLEHLGKPVKAKAPKDGSAPAATSPTTTGTAPNRASRLIVRNLPFNATEQDLRALFLPYGPIHSITLPTIEVQPVSKEEPKKNTRTNDDEDEDMEGGDENEATTDNPTPTPAPAPKPTTRNKGFAFVWMLSKKDAERALEGCNGKAIRAGLAEELVSAKQKRKKQLRLEKKMKDVSMKDATQPEGDAEEKEAKGDEEQESESEDETEEKPQEKDRKHATERVIAVDWALSKEKWKEEVSKMEEEKGDSDVEMDSDAASDSDSDSDSGSDSGDDEDGAIGVHGDESDSEAGSSQDGFSDDEDRDSDEEEPTKPSLPAPEAGTTLFVRNVPYIATEEELRTLFRAYGPLRYARITMDPATGRSRGTGFACFWNKEDADKVIEQSDILRAETTGLNTAPKKNPFSLPSILTPDPSSSLARSLVLHGRTLDVVRAVTRETATQLRVEGEKQREKQDKRNLYLLREGLIHPNSPAAASLSPAEIERRTGSYNSRRALLKSNPSLFISRTRLSVRQVPVWVSERGLKRLAVHAVREFGREVKKGERERLTAEEMEDREGDADGEDAKGNRMEAILRKDPNAAVDGGDKKPDGASAAAAKKGKGRDTGVKQTKIVRQNERVDPLTGKGRSKGYGFIEMTKHSDALKVLRWANNNASVTPLFQAWYKDELADNLKREKAKPEGERDEARIARIKEEIESGGRGSKVKDGQERGTLVVEFSIENVQVVQKRAQAREGGMKRQKEAREGGGGRPAGKDDSRGKGRSEDGGRERKGRDGKDNAKKEGRGAKRGRDESESPNKRRKVEAPSKGDEKKKDGAAGKDKKDKADAKPFNPVGAVIGRKRKEKKMGRKK